MKEGVMSFLADREEFIEKVLLYMDFHNLDDFPSEEDEIRQDFFRQYDTHNFEFDLPNETLATEYVSKFATKQDYELPFKEKSDPSSSKEMAEMYNWIDKAVELDPHCYDALRIKAFIDNQRHSVAPQHDVYAYLVEHKDECYQWCIDKQHEILRDKCGLDDEFINNLENPALCYERAEDLTAFQSLLLNHAINPYLRWLYSLVDLSFMLGRYRACISYVYEALEISRLDPAGVRRIGYYAAVKLQDEEYLLDFAYACPYKVSKNPRWEYEKDAWYLLARLYLHYVYLELDEAEKVYKQILQLYPQASEYLQNDFSIARTVYAFPDFNPHSDDEMILGVAYAKKLLFEVSAGTMSSPLGIWLRKLDRKYKRGRKD